MLLVCRCGAPDPLRPVADPVSDPARARRAPDRIRARRAQADPAAGARARRDPPAASLRVCLFHGAPRAAAEPEGDLAARRRARRDDDGRSRGRRARRRRSAVGRGVHPRRRRLADRSDRGDRDRPATRRAAPADRRDRGREPRQRRHRARVPADGDRGGGGRDVLAVGGGAPARRHDRGWGRGRARGRLCDPLRAAAPRQSVARGDPRFPDGLLRVPARLGDRRLGRARGRHGRRLHRLAHAGADDGGDAPAGRRILERADVPPQRVAVRPHRPATAADPRRDPGRGLVARHAGGCDRARGGADPDRLGVRRRLHPARFSARVCASGARPGRGRTPPSSPGPACAAPSRSPQRC